MYYSISFNQHNGLFACFLQKNRGNPHLTKTIKEM